MAIYAQAGGAQQAVAVQLPKPKLMAAIGGAAPTAVDAETAVAPASAVACVQQEEDLYDVAREPANSGAAGPTAAPYRASFVPDEPTKVRVVRGYFLGGGDLEGEAGKRASAWPLPCMPPSSRPTPHSRR